MQRPILWLLVLLAAVTVATGQSPPSAVADHWQRYVIKGEELSFELPQSPTASVIYRPRRNPGADRPAVRTKGIMYGSYGSGLVYLILSYDNSKDPENVDFFVQEMDHLAIHPRTRAFERDLRLGGFNGKQYSFDTPTLSGFLQIYRSAKHVYVIYVVQAAGEGPPKGAEERFLSSLSFASKPANYDPDNAPPPESPTISTPPSDSIMVFRSGDGPGRGGGNPAVLRNGKVVTRRMIMVVKPEAVYTEEARVEQITGTVILKCVFSSAGRVEKIVATKSLPAGLTEKAIAAAQNISFIPALNNSKHVSMYIYLEYNFNLY